MAVTCPINLFSFMLIKFASKLTKNQITIKIKLKISLLKRILMNSIIDLMNSPVH